MKLNIPQTRALDILENKITNEILFGGSAGGGKSTLLCYWQAKQRLKYPKTVGLIGRTSLKTLLETTLISFFNVMKMQGCEHTYKLYNNKEIRFNNGSVIYLKDLFYYPSDPDVDELGSLEITDAGVDEASQVNGRVREVLMSRIRYRLDENNLVPKILYVTNPGKNWTRRDFYLPFTAGKLSSDRAFVPANVNDNKNISIHYVANLNKLSKQLKSRLLYGDWNYGDDPSQLISTQNIGDIFTNNHVKADVKDIKYITADIARKGRDRTVIRIWHGWKVLERVELVKSLITDTASRIKVLMTKHGIPASKVICDEDGVGGGVVDILRCKGFVANARPNDSWNNINNANFATNKDQCGWYFAQQVNAAMVYDAIDSPALRDSIVEEIEWLKDAGLNSDGKNKLVAKEKICESIGRSPDDLDSYIMRSWFDLNKVTGLNVLR